MYTAYLAIGQGSDLFGASGSMSLVPRRKLERYKHTYRGPRADACRSSPSRHPSIMHRIGDDRRASRRLRWLYQGNRCDLRHIDRGRKLSVGRPNPVRFFCNAFQKILSRDTIRADGASSVVVVRDSIHPAECGRDRPESRRCVSGDGDSQLMLRIRTCAKLDLQREETP